jgi:exopolyphosphatase/guanosine-5'-triphosphate,3'-diphosphate pyrophosphatase
MRCAVIDVGSNSVKMLIAERDAAGQFTPLHFMSETTRLGEGAHLRRLMEVSIRRTLEALKGFAAACRDYGVERVAAVGTSAVRDAANQEEFVTRAREAGVEVEVIPGEEEARLSFLAVRLDPLWRDARSLLVVDIGGGSTEIIRGEPDSNRMASRVSLALGAVRLTGAALRSDPPTVQEMNEADAFARRALEGLDPPPGEYTAVGVGGTFTTMAAVHLGAETRDYARIHGLRLTARAVEAQVEHYAARSVEERKRIPGLDPLRADIILGGAITLNHVLQRLVTGSISVSTRGLRWGVLYDRFGREA